MKLSYLKQDITAALVLFLVALPLCLGIAQASGLGPFTGLLTGVIGGLVVTAFSPSRFAVSGPAAGLVTIVVTSIASLGSFSAFLFALVLAGILQIILGTLRAGQLITLVPASVIKGMLAAIGILLIMQQIPVALGLAGQQGLMVLIRGDTAFSWPAAAIALSGLAILACWGMPALKRITWLRWVPAPLIAVFFGGLVTVLIDKFRPALSATLPRIALPQFDSISALTSELTHPDWQAWHNPAVYTVAITLALVASMETLLSQEALKKLRPQNPPPSANKEMCAQGMGNLIAGLLGGLPITAVIVRGSVNVSAGAQSKISVLGHGVFLLVCGLWFSNLLNTIPLASLAAVLLHTGYKLASPRLFIEQIRMGAAQYVPFMVTIIGIIAVGMLAGIALGIVTQLLYSLYRSYQNALLLTRYEDHYVLRIQQSLTFLQSPRLQKLLEQVTENSVVIVDHESANYLDQDIKNTLENFRQSAGKRNIHLSGWPLAAK